jgi:hypothetical protein
LNNIVKIGGFYVASLVFVGAALFVVPFSFKLGLTMADVVTVKMMTRDYDHKENQLERPYKAIDLKKADDLIEIIESELSDDEKANNTFKSQSNELADKKNNLLEIKSSLEVERVRAAKRTEVLKQLVELMEDKESKPSDKPSSGVASGQATSSVDVVGSALKDASLAFKEQPSVANLGAGPSFKPRLGYDKDGKQMNSAGVRYQIAAVAKKLPMDYTINYLAEGEEKAQIFVFTDPTCPYCQKLHRDLGKFTKAGITVRYMFYPRGGYENNRVTNDMKAAWCSSDQKGAVDLMFAGYPVSSLGCDITETQKGYGDIVAQHMIWAQFFEITGTPTVFSSEGGLAVGYSNTSKMITALGYGTK